MELTSKRVKTEQRKNDFGIRVKVWCASCAHKKETRLLTWRRCRKHKKEVRPYWVCNDWKMSEGLRNAGRIE